MMCGAGIILINFGGKVHVSKMGLYLIIKEGAADVAAGLDGRSIDC